MSKQPQWDAMSLTSILRYFWHDMCDALASKTNWDRGLTIFWLLGPFILLIERTPADAWLSILVIAFIVRSIFHRDGSWLSHFWVRAAFVFWGVCLLSALASTNVSYAFGEAFIWFRFPLFAMATCFWLARDKRLLYAMLFSTAFGLVVMCGILGAEILIEGQKGGRLTWPYGDLVPGNYVAKVGMPAFLIMVALAVSVKGRIAAITGFVALISIVISVMTGERINFLIRACGGMLAGLVWRPNWRRYLGLVMAELLAIVLMFSLLPTVASRYTDQFIAGATNLESSPWLKTLNGGWIVAQENLLTGIGVGNFRFMSHELLANVELGRPDNHPHNYYIQLLAETGILGLVFGTIFLWSIVLTCLLAAIKDRRNVVLATAWVIPFGLFWPIATSADFFGQWNNIFMWSAVALALAARHSLGASKSAG